MNHTAHTVLALVILTTAACATGEGPPCTGDHCIDATTPVDSRVVDALPVDALPVDAPRAPIPDATTPAPDSAPAQGNARYLDRCTAALDCQSGLCALDVGGSHYCTRSCTAHNQCASEHVCSADLCLPDDTGTPCSVGSPETCTMGLCLGAGDGSGECTRDCQSALDCPAGYGCTRIGANNVCTNIEKPCASGASCGSGLCVTGLGCTASCQSAADCPPRLPFLPQYTCALAYGSSAPVCVVPGDVIGPDPIGAGCSTTGNNTCRSGACDSTAPLGPMCTQSCTAASGCARGLGCFPLIEGADVHLVCNRGGTGDLGDACTQGLDCTSGLCDGGSARCTRHCQDGLCPTGWTCLPVAGTTIALCRP